MFKNEHICKPKSAPILWYSMICVTMTARGKELLR